MATAPTTSARRAEVSNLPNGLPLARLVLAVGTWWCLLVGGEAEEAEVPRQTIPVLPLEPPRQPAVAERAPAAVPTAEAVCPAEPERVVVRVVSVFVRGRTVIINTLIRDGRLPLGRAIPEPWPTVAPAARTRAAPAA